MQRYKVVEADGKEFEIDCDRISVDRKSHREHRIKFWQNQKDGTEKMAKMAFNAKSCDKIAPRKPEPVKKTEAKKDSKKTKAVKDSK